MSNINLNIVGTGNFTQVEAAIKHLQSSIAQLNGQAAGAGAFGNLNRSITQQIAQVNALAQAQGLMKVHTTSLATEADRLTSRIAKGKTTFQDFKTAINGATRANSMYMEIAKKQLAIQNMSAIQVGKTIYGYENLGRAQLTAAQAAQANATAIAAQNAVLRQSMVHVVNWGKNMQWTGRQLTMGLTMPLVLFGAQAAKIFNDVDKNLTRLAKVYGVGLAQPTQAALQGIRKDIIALSVELGKTLGISAAEVTDIAAQFAAAGLQSNQLIYATKQAARMVVLGEADKQEAINATISLQTAYKLNTDELTQAVNFFNAAQAATSTNMADLINAIPRVGPIVKQLGGTYKDMVAIITALKEGGVPAGEAANAIKNSLGRIINPTKAAREELKKFGIDIQGIVDKNAGNLTATLKELQVGLLKLDGLSRQRAISELFGKYQFARMSAFIQNFGQVGTQSQKVMEMMGLSAQELAKIADEQTKKIQQSASGRFKIAVETLKNTLLPIGESALNLFTTVLDKVTAFFDAVNNLPGPIKSVMKGLLLIGGIVGPITMMAGLFGNLLGTVGMGVVRLKVFGGALRMLATTRDINAAKIILSGFRELDPAVTAATKAIDIFKDKEITAEQVSERFAKMLSDMTGGLVSLQSTADLAGKALVTSFEAAASAAATAAVATGSIVPPGIINRAVSDRSSILKGTDLHHAIPASFIPSLTGGKTGAGYYSYTPLWMTNRIPEVNTAIGPFPTVYSSQQGPIYSEIQKRIGGISENVISPAQKAEALATVPVSARSMGASIGIEQSTYKLLQSIQATDKKIAIEYVNHMKELAIKYSGEGDKLQFELQKLLGQILNDPRLATISTELKTSFIENTKRIQTQFVHLMEMAEIEITKAVDAATAMNKPLTGPELANLVKEKFNQTFKMLGTDVEMSVIQFLEKEGIQVTEQVREALVSAKIMTGGQRARTGVAPLIKALSQISTLVDGDILQIASSLEELAAMLMADGNEVLPSSAALIESVQTVEATAKAKIDEITTSINSAKEKIAAAPVAPGRAPLLAGRGTRQAIQTVSAIDINLSKMIAQAESIRLESLNALNAAEARQTAIKNELSINEQLLGQARADMEANQAQASARVVELEDQRSLLLKEKAVADEAALQSTKQLDAAQRRLAQVDEMLASRESAMGNVKRGPLGAMGVMGATSAIGMATMMPSMFGVHNQFTDALMQMGMITMMIGMFGTALGSLLVPVLAITAAIFAAIKIWQTFNNEIKNNAKAVEGFISLSKTETDNLGITVRKIGDIPTKDLGANADQARTAIEGLVESFKNLAEDDSLKQFIESLKNAAKEDKNQNWNVRRLQEKYMQYRAAGATEEAARNQVLALAQSAGIPLAGTEAMRRATATTAGYTQNEFILAAQKQGYQALAGNVKQSFAAGIQDTNTQAAASANAQNLYNVILSSDGQKSLKMLSEMEKQMNRNAGSANYFRSSISEMFNQMGSGATKSLKKMQEFGYSTKDQLLGAQLVLKGFVNSWQDLDKLIGTKEFTVIVNQMIRQQDIKTAEDKFTTGALDAIKTKNDAAASSTDKLAARQQKVVDRLKAELDLRKKIFDAQEKSLSFQDQQAKTQQALNEALASGDMAKVAELTRQMQIEQVRYNNELKTTAIQNKLDTAEARLKATKDQASATKNLATTTKSATDKLSDFKNMVEDAILAKGKPTQDTLNSWVKELTNMGIPTEKATKLVKDLVNEFSSKVNTTLSSDIISQLTKVASKEQELTFRAAYRIAVQSGKDEMQAAEIAYEKAYGGQVYNTGTQLLVSSGPGKSRSVYTKGQGLFPGATSSTYVGPEIITNPWVTGGTGDQVPKFVSKESAASNYNDKTKYTSFKDTRGNTWQLVPTTSGGYQWQIVGGTLTSPAYSMGGSVKYYGLGSLGGVKGAGSWTSDSIPAMLSNGEYVVNAAAVSKVGTSFMDTLNSMGYANSAPLMSIISSSGSPVIPVEIVPSNNSSSLYNDHSNINIYVNNTNASAQDIANAVSNAQQRRNNMVGSRTVIV